MNMRSERTLPLGTTAEFEKDMYFGVCDHCKEVGVRLFKQQNEWVCPNCAYATLKVKTEVKEVNPPH